jgi:NAD(P)H dehydrogenase (quinone)
VWLEDLLKTGLRLHTQADRIAELGEFLGNVIAGIYQGICYGAYGEPSDFEAVAGRPHQSWADCFGALKHQQIGS